MEIIIDRVTKQYQNKIAVDRLSLTLSKGVYGLLGANGVGKTTLIHIICGILKPTSGEVKFNGIDVSEESYRDILGYLPQDFGYYPEFSAKDFMYYMASLKGLTKERVHFRNLISELGKDRIILLSTHIVSDVGNIARTILIMKEGRILHGGSFNEIITAIEGKVFECSVDNKTAESFISDYPIVNLRTEKEHTFLRLICEQKPHDNAVSVPATLEDLYLYYFFGGQV